MTGVTAIKLVSVQPTQGGPHEVITLTLWVDPVTYLPVRFQATRTARGHTTSVVAENVSWLAPTSVNLAQLRVPVPAGFTRVPLPRA